MSNLHILNLAAYTSPQVTESKRDEWVEYGDDNNYFSFLIDRYTNSPTNNAIINNISRLVYGKGLSAIDASRKPNEYAQMMSILPKDEVRKVVKDFKMLGNAALQVIYSKDHKKVTRVYHMPVNLLRAEKCNEEGDITGYYYSDNWSDVKKFAPKRIPAFGTSQEEIEILYIQPYSVGMKYYAHPDYLGALPYALLEEEIADYLVNEVQNSFSGTKVINFNSGVPTEEQQQIIQSKVKSMFTGATGQKVIVAFNNNETEKTTVDDIQLNDAAEQYQYLSEECMRKLMLAHNVTSPLLFGIATTTGFSSNADELKNSAILFDNMVIKPIQEILIDAFDKILAYNGIALNLFFKTLQPLEFTDLENAQTQEQVAEEIGVELSSHDDKIAKLLIDKGESPNENWLLIDEYEVDYDNDDSENEMLSKEPKTSLFSKLAAIVKTGNARPNAKSEQDEVIDGVRFITRYVYAGDTTAKSRPFCKKMVDANKIYRKEDITQMSGQIVNEGWGPKGSNFYDIWLYKGGGSCHHRWNKRVYASFEGIGIDVNSPKAKIIAGKKAEKYGYVVKNPSLVSTRPVDMPNKGFLPKEK
jgi:hypothetical protein